MTRSSISAALAGLLLPCVLGVAAGAAERTAFETVKGWEVERNVGDTGPNACLMSHVYKDKDDDDAVNGVIFALDGANANIVLVYEKWEWDKNEKTKAPLSLDKRVYAANATWTGDGQTLVSKFPDAIVPNMMAAKKIILKFDNGEADFEIGGFAEGYEALRRCNATKVGAAAAPAAPSPAVPSPAAPSPAATAAPAVAGRYTVTTITSGAEFIGCLAQNEAAGIGLIAAGQSLAVVANSDKLPVEKGAAVKGTWRIDQGAANAFTLTADTPRTVTFDVPNTREAVTALISGQTLTVEANAVAVPFALGAAKQAFTDLSTCMETKKAP